MCYITQIQTKTRINKNRIIYIYIYIYIEKNFLFSKFTVINDRLMEMKNLIHHHDLIHLEYEMVLV